MRVSSSQLFASGTVGIQRNQSALLNTNNQIATGKRILTPADDPVGAARALVVTQANEVNNRHIENQGTVGDQLKLLDTKLGDISDSTQNILDNVVRAGNTGTLNDTDRKAIATDLRQRLAQLVSTANSQDGNGQYMFAGFQTNTQPFTSATDPLDSSIAPSATPQNSGNSYVTYSGDQGKRELQVDSSRIMSFAENGNDVFMNVKDKSGNPIGASVFDTVKNMIDTLEKPIATNPTFQADYNKGLGDLQSFLDNTLRIRTSVGSRMSELDALGASASSLTLQYKETLSNLQDLDVVQAYTTLTQQKTQLEAAQQSFVKISGLSLFNFL